MYLFEWMIHFCFLFCFVFTTTCCCGILVPRPDIEPRPWAMRMKSLNHWTAQEFPEWFTFRQEKRMLSTLSQRAELNYTMINFLMEKTTDLNFKTIYNTVPQQPEITLTLLSKSEYLTYLVFGRGRQWQPTPVLLPGKSHGRRSVVGCSPWGHEELDTYWVTSLSLFTFMHWRRKGCCLWGCIESDTTEAT